MISFFKQITLAQIALFFCAMLMVALIYSPFLLSLSMIGLLVTSLFNLKAGSKVSLGFNSILKQGFQNLVTHKNFSVITLFFFLVLFSGVLTEDSDYWLERLRLKLPFLFLPFAFVNLPAFSRREYQGLFYFLLMVLFFTCIGIGVNYGLHFEAINESILHGKPIPTPRHHIRFSLLLALGIIGGIFLIKEQVYCKRKWEKQVIIGMNLFLFVFIHILSVRSGLMVLYASFFFLTMHYIYRSRRYLIGLGFMAILILLPVLAYQFVPSFTNKVNYALWDLRMYQSNAEKRQNYSDTARMTSLNIGLQIGQAHPIFGIGAGNLKREVTRIYNAEYPDIQKQIMPHNQFVSVYAGMGLVGLILFTGTFFFPLFYKKAHQDAFFVAFYIIIFLSFMVENTIESSMGIGFYVFFLCLFLKKKKDGV